MRKVSEDFIGTCQACFGEFKVNAISKDVVLHGYERPGDGFIIGSCRGVDHKPFEYDTTLTVQIIEQHRATAAARTKYLADLNTGQVIVLTRFWEEYNKATYRTVQHSEQIDTTSEHWDRTLRREIANVEGQINYHTQVANYLDAKVKAWTPGQISGIDVPATGKKRALRKAYDPTEAEAEERRAAEKAARDAKPGKLKVLFYQPAVARNPNGYEGNHDAWRAWINAKDAQEEAFLDAAKVWAKANITGKSLVRRVSDYDLPRAIRQNGDFDVVAIHFPWEYRDEITKMFSTAEPYDNEPKKVSFTVVGTPRQH